MYVPAGATVPCAAAQQASRVHLPHPIRASRSLRQLSSGSAPHIGETAVFAAKRKTGAMQLPKLAEIVARAPMHGVTVATSECIASPNGGANVLIILHVASLRLHKYSIHTNANENAIKK